MKKKKAKAVDPLKDLIQLGNRLRGSTVSPGEPGSYIWFAEQMLLIRDREGGKRPLRANASQIAFEKSLGHRNIILKARQMGITTWVAARFFLKTILTPNVVTVQVAHTQEAAEQIFKVVKRFWDCLDEDLRNGPLRCSISNVRALRFAELDSEFLVVSAADKNAGRGVSIQNLHCSEVSRWPGNARETLAGLRAALAPGGEMVIESTPNGAYGCFHNEWIKAVDVAPAVPDGPLVRHFFPWWMEPAYCSAPAADLSPEEVDLIARHGLTPQQIGYRRGLEASFQQLRSQEFAEDAETCFRATGDCCFDIDAIEARLAAVGAPLEARRGGALLVWLPSQAARQYIVAVDTAGGGPDGDFASIQVIELETGLQCAELKQRLRTMELTRVAVQLAKEYGGAIIAVERNNHGAGVIAHLDSLEHYHKLYQQSGEPGWLTTAASKPAMVARLGGLLAESPWIFLSRRLLGECRTFVSLAGGRTGAARGAHDDCVMAMAVAQAVRAEMLVNRKVL